MAYHYQIFNNIFIFLVITYTIKLKYVYVSGTSIIELNLTRCGILGATHTRMEQRMED